MATRNALQDFRPSYLFWKEYEQSILSAKPKEQRKMRFDAMEWFRCESFKRAWFDTYEAFKIAAKGISKAEIRKQTPYEFKKLEEILRGEHHWLIGRGRGRKPFGWIYPYHLEVFREHFSVRIIEKCPVDDPIEAGLLDWSYIPAGVTHEGLLVLSLDPRVSDATILGRVKSALKLHRSAYAKRERAGGGGQTHSLSYLWQAIQAHDERQGGKKLLALADVNSTLKLSEQRGKKLLTLAKKMIDTAKENPTAWPDRFR